MEKFTTNSIANKMQNVDAKNQGGKKVCEFVFTMRSLTMFTWKNFKLLWLYWPGHFTWRHPKIWIRLYSDLVKRSSMKTFDIRYNVKWNWNFRVCFLQLRNMRRENEIFGRSWKPSRYTELHLPLLTLKSFMQALDFFSWPFNGSSYALEQVAEALESFHEPLGRIS